eukprot:351987-Chlamydomonas_euryale.AAC.2
MAHGDEEMVDGKRRPQFAFRVNACADTAQARMSPRPSPTLPRRLPLKPSQPNASSPSPSGAVPAQRFLAVSLWSRPSPSLPRRLPLELSQTNASSPSPSGAVPAQRFLAVSL